MQAMSSGPSRETGELEREINRLKALYKDVRVDVDRLAELVDALATSKQAYRELLEA